MKLTKQQKQSRKESISILESRMDANLCIYTFAYSDRSTVLKVREFPGSRMAIFSVAYASPTEDKVRRKTGEYLALEKFWAGDTIKMPSKITAQEFAEFIG